MDVLNKMMRKIKVNEKTGCWEWVGSKHVHAPYGRLQINGKECLAHRAMYEIKVGPIPEGMCICHACDVCCCVNPAHLWVGTRADNARDRDCKGRMVVGNHAGEHNGRSKLTVEEVKTIRKRYRYRKITLARLANEYGVDLGTIGSIIRNKSWKDLEWIGDCDGRGAGYKDRLSYKQAEQIRKRYRYRVVTKRQVAEEFGVSSWTVDKIVRGVTYRGKPCRK